jgi:hypothetical protein
MNLVDKDGQVVAQHLAQRLVHECGIGLAPESIAKFPLHHRKGGLGIAALVVPRKSSAEGRSWAKAQASLFEIAFQGLAFAA